VLCDAVTAKKKLSWYTKRIYNWSSQEIVCISLWKVAGALLNPNGIQLYSGGPIGMGTLSCDGHLGVPVLGCMLTSGQWLRNTVP